MKAFLWKLARQLFCLHDFRHADPQVVAVDWAGVIRRYRCPKCQLTIMAYND